jgi:hypothetical protein
LRGRSFFIHNVINKLLAEREKGGGMSGIILVGMFVKIVFWAAVITLVIWGIRRYTRRDIAN